MISEKLSKRLQEFEENISKKNFMRKDFGF